MQGLPHRYLTAEHPGVGGTIKSALEDFRVSEVPLYYPADRGEHTYFEVEKCDLSTLEAVERLSRALGVLPGEIGYAGLKDRKAVTRQVFSVRLVAPEKVLALRLGQMRILWARLHLNKLRIGHLQGNRFQIRVRGAAPGAAEAIERIIGVIRERGLPNFYGPQRFGSRGDSFRIGRALLLRDYQQAVRRILGFPSRAERNPSVVLARQRFMAGDIRGALEVFPQSYRVERKLLAYLLQAGDNYRGAVRRIREEIRKIYFSALQSYLFNCILDRRLEITGGFPGKLLEGDLAFLHRNGAVFRVQDPAVEQPRADGFEISPSGAIYGKLMPWPDGLQGQIEKEVLSEHGLLPTNFHQLMPGLHMKGERRPLRVEVRELRWEVQEPDIHFDFFLPRGAYATTFLREVIKTDDPPPAFYSDSEEEMPAPADGLPEGSPVPAGIREPDPGKPPDGEEKFPGPVAAEDDAAGAV